MRREFGRSIPVRVPMAGLRRPGSSWATSILGQTAEPDSDSSDVNPRRRMSDMIDSKLRSALAGAGFVNEG